MSKNIRNLNKSTTIFTRFLEDYDIEKPEIQNISMFDFIDFYNKTALEEPCHIRFSTVSSCAKPNRIVFMMDVSGLDTEFLFATDSIMISNYGERTLDPAHEFPARNTLVLNEISTITRCDDDQISHFMFADVNGDPLAIMTFFPPLEGDKLQED